eukprot:UN30826
MIRIESSGSYEVDTPDSYRDLQELGNRQNTQKRQFLKRQKTNFDHSALDINFNRDETTRSDDTYQSQNSMTHSRSVAFNPQKSVYSIPERDQWSTSHTKHEGSFAGMSLASLGDEWVIEDTIRTKECTYCGCNCKSSFAPPLTDLGPTNTILTEREDNLESFENEVRQTFFNYALEELRHIKNREEFWEEIKNALSDNCENMDILSPLSRKNNTYELKEKLSLRIWLAFNYAG